MRNWARYSLRVYGAGYLMDYAPFDPISQEYRAAHKGAFRKIVTAVSEGVCRSPPAEILAPAHTPNLSSTKKVAAAGAVSFLAGAARASDGAPALGGPSGALRG